MRSLKPGLRLKSAVCSTEIMLVRTPRVDAELHCGGTEMLAMADTPSTGTTLDPGAAGGTLIGKRYVDTEDQLEVLCTRGGDGSLSLNGAPLVVKQAKALPSSD